MGKAKKTVKRTFRKYVINVVSGIFLLLIILISMMYYNYKSLSNIAQNSVSAYNQGIQTANELERVIFSFERSLLTSGAQGMKRNKMKNLLDEVKVIKVDLESVKFTAFQIEALRADILNELDGIIEGLETDKVSILIRHLNAEKLFLARFQVLASQQVQKDIAELEKVHSRVTYIGISLAVLVTILAFVIVIRIYNRLSSRFEKISLMTKSLKEGMASEPMPVGNDELDVLTGRLNGLSDAMNGIRHFADRIGKGAFDQKIEIFDRNSDLGESLINMMSSLKAVSDRDKERNWVNLGYAEFGEILRLNTNDIEDLCDQLIHKFVKYLEVNQGAIFLVEDEDNMEMKACYAYERKKFLNKSIAKGEGLVGQVWQEGYTKFLSDIPDEFINITSGLGRSLPKEIVVIPLKSNDEIIGVIELASFNTIPEYKIQFIERVGENIAVAISTVKSNIKTQRLLEESQMMTEMLRSQEEEMRQNMEELEATQDEMFRTQEELRKKESNLDGIINNTNDAILAIDSNYKVMVSNDAFVRTSMIRGYDVKVGLDLSVAMQRKWWNQWKTIYDRALSGEVFKARVKLDMTDAGEQMIIEASCNPIMDEMDSIIGASFIFRDITDQIKKEIESDQKISTLYSMINKSDDTFFAIDEKYRILVVNDVLYERYSSKGVQLLEGSNVLDVLPKDTLKVWKDRYDRALSGEFFDFEEDRVLDGVKQYLKVVCGPIVNQEGEILGATIKSKDITKWKKVSA